MSIDYDNFYGERPDLPSIARAYHAVDQVADELGSVKAALAQVRALLAQVQAADEAEAQQFRAAIGNYFCPCGSEFSFAEDGALEDYAALNRWIGQHHDGCADAEINTLRRKLEAAEAKAVDAQARMYAVQAVRP